MVLFSTSLQIGIPLCLITIQTLQNLWHHLPHSTPVLQRWPIHSVALALCNPVCQWRRSWFVEVLAWICQHKPHALLFHMLQDRGCRYGWRTMRIHQQCIMGDIILLPSQEVLTFWWCWTGSFIIGVLKVDVEFLTPWSCNSSESRSSLECTSRNLTIATSRSNGGLVGPPLLLRQIWKCNFLINCLVCVQEDQKGEELMVPIFLSPPRVVYPLY